MLNCFACRNYAEDSAEEESEEGEEGSDEQDVEEEEEEEEDYEVAGLKCKSVYMVKMQQITVEPFLSPHRGLSKLRLLS